ncbi:MAG: CapA family protein [bacterium]|nr:CapA family protein [bacterium]
MLISSSVLVGVPASAAPRVYVDGRRLSLDSPVVTVDDRALVPARAVFEALGARVEWDPRDHRVTITADERRIELWVGLNLARVNGVGIPVHPAPILVGGRVAVPVRFVQESLGMRVEWDDRARAIRLYSGGPVAEEARATLAFAGDVLLGYGAVAAMIEKYGVHHPWDHVRAVLTGADYTLANLECAISTRGQPQPGKQWTFRGKPETLEGMRAGGVDLVNLANNHVLDYGMDAFLDTLDHLDAYGIARVGGGRNLAEALAPHIWEKDGLRVGFLGAAALYPMGWDATASRPGVLVTHYETTVMKAVRDLREAVDVVVVTVHWGEERATTPNAYQRRYARALVDNGAHLVIGHHPHVLQGMEVYRGSVIAYSLANFVFTFSGWEDSRDSIILLATVDAGGVASVRIVPVAVAWPAKGTVTEVGRPRPLEGEEARRVIGKVADRSRAWGTVFNEEGWLLP